MIVRFAALLLPLSRPVKPQPTDAVVNPGLWKAGRQGPGMGFTDLR